MYITMRSLWKGSIRYPNIKMTGIISGNSEAGNPVRMTSE